MSSGLLHPLGPLGLELLFKTTALLVAGTALSWAMRRASAAWRHLVWTLALTGCLLLPLLLALPGTLELPVPSGARLPAAVPPAAAELFSPVDPVRGEHGAPTPSLAASPPPPATAGVTSAASSRPGGLLPWLLLVWAAGCGLGLLRLVLARRRAEELRSGARRLDSGQLDGLCRALRLAPVPLLASPEVGVPLTLGIRRPALLVPTAWEGWSAERRRAVLLHELAHVARADCLTQTLARLAQALYWFHPLVHLAARSLRREAELAADDLVLGHGTRPSEYAEQLLAIARSLGRDSARPLAAVAMAQGRFEERVRAILDPARRRAAASGRRWLLAGTPALLLVAVLGTLQVSAAPSPGFGGGSFLDPMAPSPGSNTSIHTGAQRQTSADTQNPAAQYLLAQARQDHEHHGDWVKELKSHLKGETRGHKRAMKHYKQGDYPAAIDAFERWLEQHPGDATSMYNLACCYALDGRSDQAISWLRRALEHGFAKPQLLWTDQDLISLRSDPRFIELRQSQLGELEARGKADPLSSARARLTRLRESESQHGEAWYEVGYELHRLGEYSAAIEAWERSRELQHRPAGSLYNTACALARMGRSDEALAALERAVDEGSGSADHIRRDPDLASLRDNERFRRVVEMAEAFDLPSFDFGFGSKAFLAPAWQQAAERLEELVAEHPDSPRGWHQLGMASLRTGRYERSAEAFVRSHELGYPAATSAYNAACAYAALGDAEQAFDWLGKALRLQPDLIHQAQRDRDLRPLRDDPRFPRVAEL